MDGRVFTPPRRRRQKKKLAPEKRRGEEESEAVFRRLSRWVSDGQAIEI